MNLQLLDSAQGFLFDTENGDLWGHPAKARSRERKKTERAESKR